MKAVIYDYDDNEKVCDLGNEPIRELMVEVLSGDEVLWVEYENGKRERFDSSESRCMCFYDGTYWLSDKKSIEKWLKWKPKKGSTGHSYERMEAFDKYE